MNLPAARQCVLLESPGRRSVNAPGFRVSIFRWRRTRNSTESNVGGGCYNRNHRAARRTTATKTQNTAALHERAAAGVPEADRHEHSVTTVWGQRRRAGASLILIRVSLRAPLRPANTRRPRVVRGAFWAQAQVGRRCWTVASKAAELKRLGAREINAAAATVQRPPQRRRSQEVAFGRWADDPAVRIG